MEPVEPVADAGTPPARPTISVLVRDGAGYEDRPPGMAGVEAEADVHYVSDTEELRTRLAGSEALFVWDFTSAKVRAAWDGVSPSLGSRGSLGWVHIASTGVDPVLFPALVDSDVTLTNSREIFDAAIAEYVAGAVLALRKDLPRTLDLQRERTWLHRETLMVRGQVAVVVGAGPIGRAIARLLGAIGCSVRLVGRRRRADDSDAGRVYGTDELDTLLPEADVVVAAVPLTSATSGMFDASRFGLMKSSALFVNVARGAVVEEEALVRALDDGALAGAALDVFAAEPLRQNHSFWGMSNVIVSPHMSGDFVGWRDVLARTFVDNFHRWMAGRPLDSVVDKQLGYVPTERQVRS